MTGPIAASNLSLGLATSLQCFYLPGVSLVSSWPRVDSLSAQAPFLILADPETFVW